MSAIDIVSDANVALKWFHAEGEQEVEEARALLDAHRSRVARMAVLDLTPYEVGNALMRGRAKASAEQAATVIAALGDVCISVSPDVDDFRRATVLAERHGLTLYDATYAAVAEGHGAELATLDQELLGAGLGKRPRELVSKLGGGADG
ncbi:MAG: type II toxin-antitoxin system VapC family toxin [Actinobacteria bacterium]|nr:type II toxin-antitoxin system VapC family toxin [Actinomycetota bacterium]